MGDVHDCDEDLQLSDGLGSEQGTPDDESMGDAGEEQDEQQHVGEDEDKQQPEQQPEPQHEGCRQCHHECRAGERIPLSALDQIAPRSYISIILCFPIPDETVCFAAEKFKEALDQTMGQIPILAADVVETGEGKRVELRMRHPIVTDIFRTCWPMIRSGARLESYHTLKHRHMPPAKLRRRDLLPLRWMERERPRVMAVQCNIIHDGILLSVNMHHAAMDHVGLQTVLDAWARTCRVLVDGEVKPPSPSSADYDPIGPLDTTGSFDRQALMAPELPYPITRHVGYDVMSPAEREACMRPPWGDALGEPEGPTDTWQAVFELQPRPLVAFVCDEREGLMHGPISADQAIWAIIWHGITRARILGSWKGWYGSVTRLGVTVDGRKRAAPPLLPTYMGNAVVDMTVECDVAELVSDSLARTHATAALIAEADDAADNGFIRSLVYLTGNQADVSTVTPAWWRRPVGKDVSIVSWLELGTYSLQWGRGLAGGRVEFVRVPRESADGRCILLPRRRDRTEEIVVGLKVQDMVELQESGDFLRFFKHVCA